MSIQAIDSTSVHRLTSGQVVTSLQTALKELVDNALDAHASSVEVRLKEYGLASIEVVDDGCGIPKKDYVSIGASGSRPRYYRGHCDEADPRPGSSAALKHHTSKLASFADLTSVRTLGFRGEALSSLCALCDEVEVVTATAEEAPVGTRIRFDKGGNVANDDEKVARPVRRRPSPLPAACTDSQPLAERHDHHTLGPLCTDARPTGRLAEERQARVCKGDHALARVRARCASRRRDRDYPSKGQGRPLECHLDRLEGRVRRRELLKGSKALASAADIANSADPAPMPARRPCT